MCWCFDRPPMDYSFWIHQTDKRESYLANRHTTIIKMRSSNKECVFSSWANIMGHLFTYPYFNIQLPPEVGRSYRKGSVTPWPCAYGAFHLKSKFPSFHSPLFTRMPPEVVYPTQKVGHTSRNITVGWAVYQPFCLICDSLNPSYKQFCPTPICRQCLYVRSTM